MIERRLERIEAELSGDDPLLIAVVYADDQPGHEVEPLTPEQLEAARALFRQAQAEQPGQSHYVVYLNHPDPE